MDQSPRELLRFLTAGSVDDGKSTLIGRLLHDSNQIYQDQLDSVRAASARGTTHGIDFSLVTDGLRAEREQGITIDVAFRFFSTPRRKFIIADVPGHEQYTRNMATGASTAALALLVMDARKGLLPQTYRHAAIAWLLGIRNFIVAVNKMDLVEYREDVYRNIAADFGRFASRLDSLQATFVPTCAPDGDNVVHRSPNMPWYSGAPLLEQLETTPVAANHRLHGLRLPIQFVLRCKDGSRRYAGRIASGVVRPGDTVIALPSGRTTQVTSVRLGDRHLDCAFPPLSVTVALADDIDIGRGDMLADMQSPPVVSTRVAAKLLWMSSRPLEPGRPYLVKHTTRQVCASVSQVRSVIDPSTLERRPAGTLSLNEFGEVEIDTHHPLFFDPYAENRATGAFIVVDPAANDTLGAAMIESTSANGSHAAQSSAAAGLTIWFTGLSSAGKSTLSKAVHEKLWARGQKVELLDGDIVRQHLSRGLGYTKSDRDENIRRIGFVAELLTRNGVIVLVSAISPYRALREEIRARIGDFLEVYVNAPLAVCEQRDLKGIYRRARIGELHGVTGVDDPYEPPLHPDVECRTDLETLAESVTKVLDAVDDWMAKARRSPEA